MEWNDSIRLANRAVLLLACAMVTACATSPLTGVAPATAELQTRLGSGIRDLRPTFADHLCAILANSPTACNTVLAQTSITPAVTARTAIHEATEEQAKSFRIGIVPGLFASCLPAKARPLADAAEYLRGKGYNVIELDVNGRGNVNANGQQIAQQIGNLPIDHRPLILFGYSKGLIDILDALAQDPSLQHQVAAVVGWAGAAHGSMLAGRMEGLYRHTLAQFAFGSCASSDGSEVHDLTPAARKQWWDIHGAAIRMARYSLVAVPSTGSLSPGLRPGYQWLSGIDARNDGQLLWHDAIMAPGALLGFVNADHWGIGVPLSSHYPLLAPFIHDNVPRAQLMEAAIRVIATDLHPSR